MAQIAGTYQLIDVTNPEEILRIAGQEITAQTLGGITNTNSKLIADVDGDNFVLTNTIGDEAWKRETKFTLGKTYEEEFKGVKTNTVTTKDGNKLVFVSTEGGKTTQRSYEFSDDGVDMIFNLGTATEARRIYKKI